MTIALYDTAITREQFYPFSITRPLSLMHSGAMTAKHRWECFMKQEVYSLSTPLLSDGLPIDEQYLCIDATVIPDKELVTELLKLQCGEQIVDEQGVLAYVTNTLPQFGLIPIWPSAHEYKFSATRRNHAAELMMHNAGQIENDLHVFQEKFSATSCSSDNTVFGNLLFVSNSASVKAAVINTQEGPVIIDDNALVMEGCCIRGPVYIGKNVVVKMGSMIYGGTSVFDKCTIGGELKNSIIHPYSNKAHHGYLGDSVVGSWCNLGAGTSNSNIKNTAGEVHVYNQAYKQLMPAGKKAGLFMGDYSRCAVNTRFNTGTTIGVCCSLHIDSVPPLHVASFTYGINETYRLPEAIRHIGAWMQLKGEEITEHQQAVLENAHRTHAAVFNS